jgi:hypothetical protein
MIDEYELHEVQSSEPKELPPVGQTKIYCLQCKTTPTDDMYCPECSRALYAVNATFTGEP